MNDTPKSSLKTKQLNGINWDNLRKACKENDDKLTLFLEDRVIEDDWPPMTIEEWKALGNMLYIKDSIYNVHKARLILEH